MVADPPEGVELLGRPSRRSNTGREPLPEVRKWSGDFLGGPEVVGLSRRCGTGRETFPEVRKWLGDSPSGPEVVGKPSRKSTCGRETLPRSGSAQGSYTWKPLLWVKGVDSH